MCGHSTLQGTASVHCVRSIQPQVNCARYTCIHGIILYSPLYEPDLVLKSLFYPNYGSLTLLMNNLCSDRVGEH